MLTATDWATRAIAVHGVRYWIDSAGSHYELRRDSRSVRRALIVGQAIVPVGAADVLVRPHATLDLALRHIRAIAGCAGSDAQIVEHPHRHWRQEAHNVN